MTAKELATKLGLQAHSEGGWYRKTWQQPIYKLALRSFHHADGYACDLMDPEVSVSQAK